MRTSGERTIPSPLWLPPPHPIPVSTTDACRRGPASAGAGSLPEETPVHAEKTVSCSSHADRKWRRRQHNWVPLTPNVTPCALSFCVCSVFRKRCLTNTVLEKSSA